MPWSTDRSQRDAPGEPGENDRKRLPQEVYRVGSTHARGSSVTACHAPIPTACIFRLARARDGVRSFVAGGSLVGSIPGVAPTRAPAGVDVVPAKRGVAPGAAVHHAEPERTRLLWAGPGRSERLCEVLSSWMAIGAYAVGSAARPWSVVEPGRFDCRDFNPT